MRGSRLFVLGLVAVLAFSAAACGDDDDDGGDAAPETEESGESQEATTTTHGEDMEGMEASVKITEPADGATVPAPVKVKFSAMHFTIEPAGDGKVTEGHGHFHLMVDAECVTPGQVIPSDANHNHYGGGQMEASLNLTAGPHTLCLQPGDGAHTALPFTNKISITVS